MESVTLKLNLLCILLLVVLLPTVCPAAGDQFVFIRDGNVWLAGTNGTGEKQLTFSGKDRHPAISADGKWVAFSSGIDEDTGFGQIYFMEVKGGSPKKFALRGFQGAEFPAFSPDGESLVFVGLSNVKSQGFFDEIVTFGTVSLNVIDLVGLKWRTIATQTDEVLDGGYVFSAPTFSPDGKSIVYYENSPDLSGGFDIIDLAGKPVVSFPPQASDTTPYWRPQINRDGTRVLCFTPTANNPPEAAAIYLVNPSKGTKKKIAEGMNPTFVNRGKAILYEHASKEQGNGSRTNLWLLDLTPGAQPRKMVNNGSQPGGQPWMK
jgi:Tol biopolymer transport system component